jgi:3-dehydroquinate synthase
VLSIDLTSAPTGVHLQRVPVQFDYPVIFQRDCLAPSSTALRWAMSRDRGSATARVLVIADAGLVQATPGFARALEGYFAAHCDALSSAGELVVIPGGEQAKADEGLVSRLHQEMLHRQLDRHSVVLIFGGGAVLDAAGYAAATFHRGVRVVRVPTTVLGQNDAGVGVKNGVNAFGVKNLVGTFQAPYAVICDSQFLGTLEARDVTAGLAEAVKVSLIRDPEFFRWLQQNAARLVAREEEALGESVRRAALLHLGHIAQGGDPFETGSARPLDFGHWSAHKLEVLSHHSLRHGEAVAIGMAIDVRYAESVGLLSAPVADEICSLLAQLGFTLPHAALGDPEVLLRGLEEFREHIGGELTITQLRGIGQAMDVHEIDRGAMRGAIWRVALHGAR